MFEGVLPEAIRSAWLFTSALAVFSFLLLIWFLKRKSTYQKVILLWPGFTLLFVIIGVLYSKGLQEKVPAIVSEGAVHVSACLLSDLEEKGNNYVVSAEIDLWYINDTIHQDKQKLRLYIKKDSLVPKMYAGEKWIFGGEVRPIKNNGNPGEFDYAAYMQRKGFWNVLFVSGNSYTKISGSPARSIKYLPDKIARNIRKDWNMDDPDIAVLNAITMGDKRLLTHETKSAFSGSGAMHLLAVSGLHVGMIWWILDKLIRFPRRKRFFKFAKVLIILGILWIYAGITGFSDSVTRSVTMFSLVSVATLFSRTTNIYNTLFLSAFLLLVLKPSRIVEPGFQLSYLAVFGIVTIHPLLCKIIPVQNRFLKRVLDLIFVSIAAQLATLPISLLYFHIYPLYFLLTNLVAIPIVSLILAMFVLFAPLFLLNIQAEFFSMILLKATHLLNVIVNLISSFPGAVIENISINPMLSVSLLFLVFATAAIFIYKRVRWMILSLAILVSGLLISAKTHQQSINNESTMVYNFHDCTAIQCVTNGKAEAYLFFNNMKPSQYTYDYLKNAGTLNMQKGNSILVEIETEEDSLYHEGGIKQICKGAWGLFSSGKRILICGDCQKTQLQHILQEIQWDVVIFRAGLPFLSQQHTKLLEGIEVIADGSLQNYELKHLRNILTSFYETDKNGAYSLSSKEISIQD